MSSNLLPLKKKNLPKPLPLRKLIGPSFIILGVGLGSGELILWPYLVANFGLGIAWAAILGISFQFVINMEIERYSLVTGESIFVGLARKFGRFTPFWFICSTFVPWMWPGILAASATALAAASGLVYSKYIGIALLLVLGGIYSIGSIVYKTQEKFQKGIILVGVPFIFLLTAYLARATDWSALASGLVPKALPTSIPLATFLAALAYAGAGGNLNLAQSLYVKEKGYGMGKYAGRITNILRGKSENINLEGFGFELSALSLKRFRVWWRRINLEHALVFWATGAATMLLLMLLSYSTVFGKAGNETSIIFVVHEAATIAQKTFPFLGTFFLLMVTLMLFGTQFSVYGSNARIMSENLVITDQNRFKISNLPKYFYGFLWLQILAGVIILAAGFIEPLALVVTGAVLNAISMFIYTGMVLILNLTKLEKPLRPSVWRIVATCAAFLFYGAFSGYVIFQNLSKLI